MYHMYFFFCPSKEYRTCDFFPLIRFSSKAASTQQSGSLTRTSVKSSSSLCGRGSPGLTVVALTACPCGLENSLHSMLSRWTHPSLETWHPSRGHTARSSGGSNVLCPLEIIGTSYSNGLPLCGWLILSRA